MPKKGKKSVAIKKMAVKKQISTKSASKKANTEREIVSLLFDNWFNISYNSYEDVLYK